MEAMLRPFFSLLLLVTCLALSPAKAADEPKSNAKKTEAEKESEEKVEERTQNKDFEFEANGNTKFGYSCTAGTIILRDKEQKPTATVFYVAYNRKTKEQSPEKRPLVFAFNGGPGSSSVWLHLGALGPRIVNLSNGGTLQPRPPYSLMSNPHTMLDIADLVFIDPVGTGFSRVEKNGQKEQFHGVDEDIKAVADFIRLYTSKNDRWTSPKYLMGESYGAIRAAGLAEHLQDEYGMYLNGVMLLSGLLDYSTILPADNNDLPFVLFLPSMTATAFYHKKLKASLQAELPPTLTQAEEFARGDYATGLFKGSSLEKTQKTELIAKLADFTGLSPAFVEECNLRVSPQKFMKELLRSEGKTVGRLDSRVIGTDGDQSELEPEYDPSMTLVMGPFSTLLNDYLRRELKFSTELPYEIMGDVKPWKYPTNNAYVSVAERLASAMRKNPHLYVHVACGHYDLATPYFAIIHSIDHLKIDQGLREHFTIDFYPGGHMMYSNMEALKKLKEDLQNFITKTLSN